LNCFDALEGYKVYDDELLKQKDLRKFLNFSESAFRRARLNGSLPPAIQINGRRYWLGKTVNEWLTERESMENLK
jgi:predicted DNA-binding transcriptional regulator AlpA